MNPAHNSEPCILVEGPKWADAEFYGRWLLMASTAQALWEKAVKSTRFRKQIGLLTTLPMSHFPSFDNSACLFLFQLNDNLVSFTISLPGEDWAELQQFALMAEMGFFVLTEGRYQMAVPAKLSIEVVKSAALRLAETDDGYGLNYPEDLVSTMPYALAEEWQTRLRGMNGDQRCADRAVLLAKQLNKGRSSSVADSIGPNF